MSIERLDLQDWQLNAAPDPAWQAALEDGAVLYCPNLCFALSSSEQHYLDPSLTNQKRKSIYIRGDSATLYGTDASANDQEGLLAMLTRYRSASMHLLTQMFPGYGPAMRPAGTSFRPRPTGTGEAALSWRKDDTRLHVDAFPSNPTRGLRILRVFSNVGTSARVWRVGESFEDMARRFVPNISAPLPGFAALIHSLGITKRKRSAYDHYMLHLHDRAKADLGYQRDCAQQRIEFAPASSWICFSDQVMHAAESGQYMIEQTIHLPRAALAYPEHSPLRILERMAGRELLPAAET